MGLFRQRPKQPEVSDADPFASVLVAKYQDMVESFRGSEKGTLRLVTGGPVQLTRPIAVRWSTESDSSESYRGDPNFDSPAMADREAEKTFEHFDAHVATLRQNAWRLIAIDGRNLFFERG